jgi:hypothetical protein
MSDELTEELKKFIDKFEDELGSISSFEIRISHTKEIIKIK